MIMGIVANQNPIHHEDTAHGTVVFNSGGGDVSVDATTTMAVLISMPIIPLIIYLLIFGWLKVADTLNNPFGFGVYDVDLAAILDLNIWKSSVMLENQEKAVHSNFLKILPPPISDSQPPINQHPNSHDSVAS